jgi:YVTN family beta-propeller protein
MRLTALSASLALALSMALVGEASAATVSGAWVAKVGSGGANGSATVSLYTSGTGSIALNLVRLRASALLPVVIAKGSCSGPALVKLAALKTSSAGAATRTSSLTSSQSAAIRNATGGSGKIALRVGSSSTGGVKCGVFAASAMAPYLAATIPVGRAAIGVAVASNGVLVANWYDRTLSRIDPVTNSVLSVIPLTTTGNEGPQVIAVGQGAVWVAMWAYDDAGNNTVPGSVERLDPVTDALIATIPVGTAPIDITTSPGAVWVANYDDGTVTRIDSATNQVAATITLSRGVTSLAFDFGSLWVSNEQSGSVSRIDPATNATTAVIPTVGSPEGVASAAGAIWVANYGTDGQPDGVLSRIDPATNQVTKTIPVGSNPLNLASDGGSLWVGPWRDASVLRVNPITAAVTRISTGAPVLDSAGKVNGVACIVATGHTVWATQDVPAADSNSSPPPSKLYRVNY